MPIRFDFALVIMVSAVKAAKLLQGGYFGSPSASVDL